MAGEPTCPGRGVELSIGQFFDHAEVRDTFAGLIRMSGPAGTKPPTWAALFPILKKRRSIPREVRLLEDLLTDFQNQAIHREERDGHVPAAEWISAIAEMLAACDPGELELPSTSRRWRGSCEAGSAIRCPGGGEPILNDRLVTTMAPMVRSCRQDSSTDPTGATDGEAELPVPSGAPWRATACAAIRIVRHLDPENRLLVAL